MSFTPLNLAREIQKVKDKAAEHVNTLHKRRAIVELANALAQEFNTDTEDMNLSVSTDVGALTHGKTVIDLHLSEDQSIDSVKPLLKKITLTRKFGKPFETDYLDMGWVGWVFLPLGTSGLDGGQLMVRVWFGSSKVCRLEPTGEMKPVMKVVCDHGEGE